MKEFIFVALAIFTIEAEAIASETISYTYDAQGRLTKVQHSGTVNNNVQSSYSFDDANNRTNVTIINANSLALLAPNDVRAASPPSQ